ncbi:helix-turn-helix domain-containing protein [Streptomyces luteolus]|uniref:Helix-turn-helix transcriptional regulator n=1 Tax=Streptomyces luteolus TaxID=3043615 RepID=A0ABT6T4Z6_9ACTN|nr:helix-turn-helix transcriptional regulator [Streptomyces sp. B-S-A12]MDI3422947.1 helix-turn-helix transcriptional regulator [Streptomyces sp. B-S-A12]
MKLARVEARLSQRQVGEACGTSQAAVSRLEGRGVGSYDTAQLARVANHLQIPPHLVGLADHTAAVAARGDGNGTDVERRSFVGGVAAIAVAPALSMAPTQQAFAVDSAQAATLRAATTAFRRLDGTTPSRQLVDTVLSHLRLTQAVAQDAETDEERARLAAVGSEVASLAGWLHWDMGDNGSARTWYGASIKAARRSANPLLAAYQLGSLAQFEAHAGNAAQGLTLTRSARKQLGDGLPAIADAWLSGVEALAHAAVGDPDSTDQALTAAARRAEQVKHEEAPPWPWVFSFTEAKVAALRVSCGARLGLPRWISGARESTAEVMAPGHDKQRALLMLDIASGHLAAGRLDGAFTMAARALETGLRYKSGRIVERARAVRRSYSGPTPPKVVRDFDDRLHGVFL